MSGQQSATFEGSKRIDRYANASGAATRPVVVLLHGVELAASLAPRFERYDDANPARRHHPFLPGGPPTSTRGPDP